MTSAQTLASSLQSQSVLDNLSINQNSTTTEKTDKNQFLTLMVAQLKNQNPLDPQDGTQFLSQLAQFSTVEGIQTLNDSMSQLSSGYRSGQALQATALVGRRVEVPSDTGILKGAGGLTGSIDLNAQSPNVSLQIQNAAGDLVKTIALGDHAAGSVPFKWDGLDNQNLPVANGEYALVATAQINGKSVQMPTQVAVNVNSVTLGKDGEVMVNLDGMGSVSLDDLKNIGN
jgi:flagellar basal-body rod modification protein FlgD